jgi:NADPH-dependent 2,4-dienoyl-CoA reductase/sulfur reductase-like enzyme
MSGVVIVGNGVAGIEAARGLRAREPRTPITIVSCESDHFVARTALMYVLVGQLSLRDIEPFERDLYERERFARVRGRAVRLDVEARTLHLADGGALTYERLLLAVGSRGRRLGVPGESGSGVHPFIGLEDLRALDAAAVPGRRAVVVGGGLTGIEAAEALHARGLRVTFLIRESRYSPVMLDARESAVVVAHVRARGVDVRTGVGVSAIERVPETPASEAAGHVRAVTLDDGSELPAEVVVVTVGVEPNTAWLRGALPMSVDGAIEVDDGLRAAPGVWAAGDCANVRWIDGSRRPEQLWYTARDQGRAVARALAGDPICYRRHAWVNAAKLFDLEYTTAGWIPSADAPDGTYRSWYRHEPAGAGRAVDATLRIVCKDDRVVGFNALGARWDPEVWLRWIQQRRSLDAVLADLPQACFEGEFAPCFGGQP